MKKITVTTIGMILAHFLFAFANWQFNPAFWTLETRYACAVIMGSCAFVIIVFVSNDEIKL